MRPILALCVLSLFAALPACDEEAVPSAARWSAVEALVRTKDYPAAYAALEKMQVPGKVDTELTLRLAEVRRLEGNEVKAVLLLRAGLEADPKAKQLIVPLGMLYLQIGEVERAREVLEKGRTEGVETAESALLLGQTYGRMDQLDRALAEFDRAATVGAKAHVVLYNKGLIWGQQGKHDEAIAAMRSVVEAAPDWPAARRELARAILDSLPKDRAAVEGALDMLIGAKTELPEDWRLHESIGDAWLLLGDYDAAVVSYTDALRFGRNPKSVEDRYRVAETKRRERESAAVPPPPK